MYKHIILRFVSGVFLLFLISCSVSEISETASDKAPTSPKPGDCIACHEGKEVIPGGHVDIKKMMSDECGACHEPGPSSLRGKIPLSHTHYLDGITCKGCHEDPASAKAADMKVCQTCHSDPAALIEAASELEINPHFSPHEGKISDCNKCHHMHKSSENNCAHCHGLDYKVP